MTEHDASLMWRRLDNLIGDAADALDKTDAVSIARCYQLTAEIGRVVFDAGVLGTLAAAGVETAPAGRRCVLAAGVMHALLKFLVANGVAEPVLRQVFDTTLRTVLDEAADPGDPPAASDPTLN